MDKKLVQIGGTSIEVADLIGPAGELVHVKRKTQSATLSHLFSQGRISAEALKGDDAVRRAAADLLDADGRVPGALLRSPFDARTKTVVYAVIAANANELPSKLPVLQSVEPLAGAPLSRDDPRLPSRVPRDPVRIGYGRSLGVPSLRHV